MTHFDRYVVLLFFIELVKQKSFRSKLVSVGDTNNQGQGQGQGQEEVGWREFNQFLKWLKDIAVQQQILLYNKLAQQVWSEVFTSALCTVRLKRK